jgi:site-specific DNA recombinase
MSKGNGKLRFAALIRVSTEKQAAQGESLRTQEAQLSAAVASLGGTIVKRYAGQEHATAGYERQQVERLLADSARKPRPFDAVIVADPTRWSRDNVKSETGLERLRDCEVRFFVLATESDLFNPQDRFFLSMFTTIGAFHAGVQKQKSLLNRIGRAKRQMPTCGKLPYGRVWDKRRECWTVDPAKLAIVQDAARRYLAGESLAKLAREYGMNHSNLHKILTKRCGDKWTMEFRADDLNVNETVEISIPRLLPEKTIKAVRQRVEANKTYQHGDPKHDYRLGGFIFCGHCGYNMFGQMNHGNRRYYRHAHTSRARACSINPRPWVRADQVETEVIRQLVELFGNPAAIERAIERAIPNQSAVRETEKRIQRLKHEMVEVEKGRDRVLDLVIRNSLNREQVEAKLADLKQREADLQIELDKAVAAIGDLPTAEQVREAGQIALSFGNHKGADEWDPESLSREDREALIQEVFGSPLPDGRPAGVYVFAPDKPVAYRSKDWRFTLRGRIAGVTETFEGETIEHGGEFQLVTPYASRSRGTAPPPPRSALPPPRPRA